MHSSLTAILAQLKTVVTQLRSAVPNDEPFGNAHNNWSFPGLNRAELIDETESLIKVIEENAIEDIEKDRAAELNDYVRRLKHLHTQTIPNLWGNAGQAVTAFMLTLQGLRRALTKALPLDNHAAATTTLRRLTAQVRSMEARLLDLEPRTTSLTSMVSRIEAAHEAADQLPTDLASLAESRSKLETLLHDSTIDFGRIESLRTQADELDRKLRQSADDAKAVIDRCETAYSAATSVGLAAAFSERSLTLSKSMWFWVAGLIAALAAGSHFGSTQLQSLVSLFTQPNVGTAVIALNLLLSILSVAAPVWFGWLATKQIGQRFRLAEDYAFKASISRAYEGFRREAAKVDKNMEAQLLASALNRLDEQPLRLVESDSHGSPWHEIAASDSVKQALRAVPGFAGQIKELAESAIDAVKSRRTTAQKVAPDQDAA
ncbi:hypothetical protein H010_03667 [Hydrogenophaga taeniospiralis CCUG 15921]|uniref:Uncharacterized protein n=1 Tax=Hydrogenophaga taeniospiralis CCUG 15921 TaxID=1281780 RepID=A0A9X4NQS0_9BURK|nr:hypothetical protein [Hydrogenophaga taeniospiralis]MDG5974334.1 hypothetical protein [Hydrogenophaga taeniospiralis CCUG 15921]